jgi:hypothetical protein
VIGAYLAGQYPHSSSNTSYALSSVADTHITHVSGLTVGTDPVAEEQKSMQRAQRLEQKEPARAGLPHKRFLVKEQSLFE